MDPVEDACADAVEGASTLDGRTLGPRTARDASDPSGLRVDFTYDKAHPRVAIEISELPDTAWYATHSEARKVGSRLESFARQHDLWAHWEVTIRTVTDLARIEETMRDVLLSGESIDPNDYRSHDLMEWASRGELEAKKEWREVVRRAGIDRAQRRARGGVTFSTWSESKWGVLAADELQALVTRKSKGGGSNATSALQEATQHGYRPELAIAVTRFGVTLNPQLTPVPNLNTFVERVWLVHLWRMPGAGPTVWSTTGAPWVDHGPV